jgi:hypothetical protein
MHVAAPASAFHLSMNAHVSLPDPAPDQSRRLPVRPQRFRHAFRRSLPFAPAVTSLPPPLDRTGLEFTF